MDLRGIEYNEIMEMPIRLWKFKEFLAFEYCFHVRFKAKKRSISHFVDLYSDVGENLFFLLGVRLILNGTKIKNLTLDLYMS